ncbi:hypothetical protein P1X15_19230 [Runella sp. MFBS21]|uniref:hypothetical protein n=1 Tax=Runella sp. MFBS21 TaxID=3034018 RepID=UPI0023F67B82|nr:hypothetical protein [Runella sp. MFBS21]MDF7819762.1 hypothetical protein [Runella sp. MFBS21]
MTKRPVFDFEPKIRWSDGLQGIAAARVRSRGNTQKLSDLLINFVQPRSIVRVG